ncbi:MAG: hypothetical protein ACE5D6_01645 [Candidatus Zixiibacteriota bacterium]
MYKIKPASKSSKKSSPFFAFVRSGELLVTVLSSPKSVVECFKKNKNNIKKIHSINNN